jgi:DedD protein
MANTASTSATQDSTEKLRQRANRRLLGASVLLLIAIIMVPIFLEREPPPLPDNIDVKIPPVEGTKFEPRFPDGKKGASASSASVAATEVPAITEPTGAQAGVAAEGAAATAATAASAMSAATKSPESGVTKESQKAAAKALEKAADDAAKKPAEKAPAKEATKEAAKEAAKDSPKDAAKAPEAPRKPGQAGQLIVQLIAVRDAAAAKETFSKAKSLKFPVYTESIDVANGKVTRVRVGPYDTKQAAETARAKLAQAGFEAKVITLQ